MGPDTTALPGRCKVGRLDVSAETQPGIGRLPFDLIRISRFVRTISRTTLLMSALERVEFFFFNLQSPVTDRLGDKFFSPRLGSSSHRSHGQ